MMDKELLEKMEKMLEDLKEIETHVFNNDKSSLGDNLFNKLEKAFNEEIKVSIETHKNGVSKVEAKGSNIGLLVALAGLEKAILEKINPPKGFWEIIKNSVGVKNNE